MMRNNAKSNGVQGINQAGDKKLTLRLTVRFLFKITKGPTMCPISSDQNVTLSFVKRSQQLKMSSVVSPNSNIKRGI